jgi:hypothetical protein
METFKKISSLPELDLKDIFEIRTTGNVNRFVDTLFQALKVYT